MMTTAVNAFAQSIGSADAIIARRRHIRQRVVCTAYLEKDDMRPILCMVRDLSDGGAQLRIPLDSDLTGALTLHVPELGWKRPVRIVWNHRHSIGVQFAVLDNNMLTT